MSALSGIHGQTLEIKVVACEKLLNKEFIGLMDPYVELEYGNVKYRTDTCTDGGTNPVFGDIFHMTLIEGHGEITASVWNSNMLRPRDFIGYCKVELEDVLTTGVDDRVWCLQTKSTRHRM